MREQSTLGIITKVYRQQKNHFDSNDPRESIPDRIVSTSKPYVRPIDPYVVFFSNIFAILGLRAMFFLLAGVADKFWLLKPGVSFLLLFIGIKLLIHDFIEIDAVWSLVFIVLVLVVSIVGSLVVKKKTA